MKRSNLVRVFLSAIFFIVGCAKDSPKNTSALNTAQTYYLNQQGICTSSTGQQVPANYCTTTGNGTNPYYLNNQGICTSTATGQQVPANYCTTNGNGTNPYYLNNQGVCTSTATGQPVDQTYCSNTNGTNSQQCMGIYYYMSYYGIQGVYCYGTNCRGYTLFDQTGRQVTCQ